MMFPGGMSMSAVNRSTGHCLVNVKDVEGHSCEIISFRCVALGPALMVACYATSGPGLDGASDWLNVLQSVQLPFAMLPVTILSSSSKLMGVHANGIHTQVCCKYVTIWSVYCMQMCEEASRLPVVLSFSTCNSRIGA